MMKIALLFCVVGAILTTTAAVIRSSDQDKPAAADTIVVRAQYQLQLERELQSIRENIASGERQIGVLRESERRLEGMLMIVTAQRDSLIRFPKSAFQRPGQ